MFKRPFTTIHPNLDNLNLHYQRLASWSLQLGLNFDLSEGEFCQLLSTYPNPAQQALKVIIANPLRIELRDYKGAKPSYKLQTQVVGDQAGTKMKLAPNDQLVETLQSLSNKGYDDQLLIDSQGCVCETLIANIFLIKDRIIKTPPISGNVLDGTVRQVIIANNEVEIANLTIEQLLAADLVFITNSLKGIQVVSGIDDYELEPDIALLKTVIYKLAVD